jgi:hypothetical protein
MRLINSVRRMTIHADDRGSASGERDGLAPSASSRYLLTMIIAGRPAVHGLSKDEYGSSQSDALGAPTRTVPPETATASQKWKAGGRRWEGVTSACWDHVEPDCEDVRGVCRHQSVQRKDGPSRPGLPLSWFTTSGFDRRTSSLERAFHNSTSSRTCRGRKLAMASIAATSFLAAPGAPRRTGFGSPVGAGLTCLHASGFSTMSTGKSAYSATGRGKAKTSIARAGTPASTSCSLLVRFLASGN